jgi:hypothetical protein
VLNISRCDSGGYYREHTDGRRSEWVPECRNLTVLKYRGPGMVEWRGRCELHSNLSDRCEIVRFK